ncbi:deoxyribose-phosphate aldolase, partial [Staphylococcus felis]
MNYEKYIDHTLLKPETTRDQIDCIIEEAKTYHFKSVCVNPTHVEYVAQQLEGSDVLVCTVIGFPLGASTTETKAFETRDAIAKGADEIDMVINIGALKDGRDDDVQRDIAAVVEAAQGHTVKVIIETVLL